MYQNKLRGGMWNRQARKSGCKNRHAIVNMRTIKQILFVVLFLAWLAFLTCFPLYYHLLRNYLVCLWWNVKCCFSKSRCAQQYFLLCNVIIAKIGIAFYFLLKTSLPNISLVAKNIFAILVDVVYCSMYFNSRYCVG